MLVLGLDTTRKSAKVFLVDTKDNEKSIFSEMDENVKHSDGLFLHIEKVLVEKGINIAEIDAMSCVVGPGSFTGIRVGMSTIKGLNKVLNKSVIAMNAFEVLLDKVSNGLIVLNSTHTSCYYARVLKSNIVETGNVEKSKISELANNQDVILLKEEQELIGLEYNKLVVIDSMVPLYFNCIVQKLNTMQYGDFVPYYLQLSQAERNQNND